MYESELVNPSSMPSYQKLLTTYPNKNFDSSHLVPLGVLARLQVMQGPG